METARDDLAYADRPGAAATLRNRAGPRRRGDRQRDLASCSPTSPRSPEQLASQPMITAMGIPSGRGQPTDRTHPKIMTFTHIPHLSELGIKAQSPLTVHPFGHIV